MNETRYQHSSCELGQSIYVFCGKNQSSLINSIEKLDVSDANNSAAERSWQKIRIPEEIFPLSRFVYSVPLNDKEILIFGKFTSGGGPKPETRRSYIFNSEDHHLTRV